MGLNKIPEERNTIITKIEYWDIPAFRDGEEVRD